MNRWLQIALELAEKSSHSQHKMAALVVRGGAILSGACNGGGWGRHAERRAIRPHRDYFGATVYVVRTGGKLSKPCKECQKLLEEAGITKVICYNEQGEVIRYSV